MTLIVGIKCSDGIVVGADGAATFAAMGQPTIRQSVRKLNIIQDRIIVGVSGSVGLGQRIVGEVERIWSDKKLTGKSITDAMPIIAEALRKHILPELQVAANAKQLIGQMAMMSAVSSSIVAVPLSKAPCLMSFDQQGAPEAATDDLPFVSIGSGQGIADPFLAFLRRIFWPNKPPTVSDGIFATLWCLQHAIQTNAGGVADPKQIVVLSKDGAEWKAREIPETEFQEHLEAIQAAEQALVSFRDELRNGGTTPSEPPPKATG